MIVVQVLAVVVGVAMVVSTMGSAIRTVVVPRAVIPRLTRFHFVALRKLFGVFTGPKRSFESRDSVMSLYAPLALVTLPGLWVAVVLLGFTSVFWGTGVHPLTEAFTTSGSSLFTLGFVRSQGAPRIVLEFVEAGIGLGLISLMISYLPTIYSTFSRRETLVGMLEVARRASAEPGRVADPVHEDRMARPDRRRPLRALGVVVRRHRGEPHQPAVAGVLPLPASRAQLDHGCRLRARYGRDRSVDSRSAAQPELRDHDPQWLSRACGGSPTPSGSTTTPIRTQTDPITISRAEFDLVCDELRALDVPLKRDLDQAWRDFSGWRVNYDEALVRLCALTMAPPAKWSSDRIEQLEIPKLRFMRRRKKQ